jgi:hypothetical protein
MLRMLRNLSLVSAALVLAGCQHPLAPSATAINDPFADARPALVLAKATYPTSPAGADQHTKSDSRLLSDSKSQDAKVVVSAQEQPEGLSGQLADGLFQAFKTFTGH